MRDSCLFWRACFQVVRQAQFEEPTPPGQLKLRPEELRSAGAGFSFGIFEGDEPGTKRIYNLIGERIVERMTVPKHMDPSKGSRRVSGP